MMSIFNIRISSSPGNMTTVMTSEDGWEGRIANPRMSPTKTPGNITYKLATNETKNVPCPLFYKLKIDKF